ncbi:hydroxylamine oxidation protein HaoB [Nitrosomonas sp.]|uniref:hydroxylamine oxidation protein HaoB n=1 Tax=Nitrosomonas sp. TaxID=42353 RepID=UPI002843DDE6|nr:hydroxylamine oxidation protein HaoB [Nitrosomonas sp.]MCP5242024.1 hydroxylamine oxidation protein HaoB [Burkholderiales bacterium]MCP5242537.1 hydroxylamine oxidation protein HaoB [Burkholderiales bacterium]MCP5243878.1 hydroxylamine oxidation protein HaoB [Burkholderiales bacterium]MDR4514105.1 hydroxylamine oxidation protein HaoB [Nitrosomonas sp.]MDR4514552.1 hydroxylamine oxidation protein HaoB [Nitrosomonas sp.]
MIPAETTGRDTQVKRSGDKLLPSLGILLVTGGLILLGWFAYLWFEPADAPYHYQQTSTGGPQDYPELELDAWPDLKISRYDVIVPEAEKPVAQATVAQRDGGSPVLIKWQNNSKEILHALDWKSSELSALAAAISQYAEKDALILAWWDISQQINLLTGHDTLFTGHLNEPLIIPQHWQTYIEAIDAYEQSFWQSKPDRRELEQFERFSLALTAEPEAGVAQLRELVGAGRTAYIIVHVTDLYKLGLLYPEKIGVAYQNFPLTGNIHGMINHMKVQLKEHDFDTYTLQSITDTEIRVYFLSDEQSSKTLLARMLPFTDKDAPTELEALQLLYQRGGYWLYKIPAAE